MCLSSTGNFNVTGYQKNKKQTNKQKIYIYIFVFQKIQVCTVISSPKLGRMGDGGSTSGCERRNSIPTLKRLLNLKK